MEMFEYCPKVVQNLCKLCEFFIIPYFCLFEYKITTELYHTAERVLIQFLRDHSVREI